MRSRFLAAVALLLALPLTAFGQTTVRIKDANGNTVCELYVPAPGSVEIIPGPGPGPQPPLPPNPQPPIPPPAPPNPNPPAPVPVVGPIKHVIVISDATAGVMTPAQVAALRDPALRTKLLAKGWAWHEFDRQSAEVTQKPPAGLNYAKWLGVPTLTQAPNLAPPCVLLLDAQGRLIKGFAEPADVAGLSAALGVQ